MWTSFISDLSLPWILIIGSSLSSVLGATVVFIDKLVRKWTPYHDFTLSENKFFISSILSFSSGILFYSSQFILLPEALEAIRKTPFFSSSPFMYLALFYTSGVIFMFILNKVIAFVAPSAIACPCSHDSSSHAEISSIVIGDNLSEHAHEQSHKHLKENKPNLTGLLPTETSKLISNSCPDLSYNSLETLVPEGSYSRISVFTSNKNLQSSSTDCDCNFLASGKGGDADVWSSIPIRDMEQFSHVSCKDSVKRFSSGSSVTTSNQTKIILPREVEDRNQLWSIGIQTAIAVSLHKLPEGIITVVSSGSSESLGVSLFIGIACHNFPEGFMLAIPFYAATNSALKAFCFASLIGGLTQPFGGFVGMFLLHRINQNHIVYFNGILFALVSGLMSLVILQSFIPTIRRQLVNQSALPAIFSFVVGAIMMGAISFLFGHDH